MIRRRIRYPIPIYSALPLHSLPSCIPLAPRTKIKPQTLTPVYLTPLFSCPCMNFDIFSISFCSTVTLPNSNLLFNDVLLMLDSDANVMRYIQTSFYYRPVLSFSDSFVFYSVFPQLTHTSLNLPVVNNSSTYPCTLIFGSR